MRTSEGQGNRLRSLNGRAVVALGGILILSVLAMTSYEIWRQRATALGNVDRQLESLSLALAEQTHRSFDAVELVINATAAAVDRIGGIRAAGTLAIHESLRERTTGVPAMVGLAVIDADGSIVNAARSFPPPVSNVTARGYFQHHLKNPSPDLHIGAPVNSPVDGRWVITVTQRLSGPDGSFEGIVLAAIDPSYFQEFYARVLPGKGSAFALFRTDGMLLARYPEAAGKLGQNFRHLAVFQPGMPDKGKLSGPSPIDGARRILSYNHVVHYPLLINVSLNEDDILLAWRENAVRLSLAALAAVAVMLTSIIVLYRQIGRAGRQALALRHSEERLMLAQFALDHAADMVLWLDHQGRVLYANNATARRLDYQPGELDRLVIGDIAPQLGPLGWNKLLEDIRENRQMRFETNHRTRDGEVFPVEISLNYLEFMRAEFVCAFARDISARRQAEAILAEKTASLESSNAELEQFAYVASHDLREPLRMVNSFVTMLARRYADKLDDEGREFIAFAQDGAIRMDRLILDLLEYSRVGRIERPLVPVSLSRTISLAVKGLALSIEEAGAEIVVAPDLPTALANDEELNRLYLNLIGNALKYRSPDRPCRIVLSAERVDGEIVCSVADNGIGIAVQYYERIFRIFQRLHGRDKYDGTGIGLAICKKIVERHGGRIWVESVPDQGATFFFTLKPAD